MLRIVITALTLSNATNGLPAKPPSAVGMSASRLESVDRIVHRGILAGGYPGAAVVIGRKGAAVWEKGFGTLSWSPNSGAVVPNSTIYDVASLTKVIATTSAVMALYDDGLVDLDAPVTRYLPAFAEGSWNGNKDLVTVRHLLTHRSGLPAGREVWRLTADPQKARQLMLATPLETRPGEVYVYSDVGAYVLGALVERISGMPLDQFVHYRVFEPLGMTQTFFRPSDTLTHRIAPTSTRTIRGYALRGEVHDETAHALGDVSGHAGLFSTAADLSVFAQMMLNGGMYDGVRIFRESTVSLFTRRAAGHRALGWDTAEGDYGSGHYLTQRAYGHTGYTGTSIWIDPDREMFVILLTNRVHDARAKFPAKVISDVRSDLSDAAALAVIDGPWGTLDMPKAFRADRAVGWNEPVRRVKKKAVKLKNGSKSKSSIRGGDSKRGSGKASSKARKRS